MAVTVSDTGIGIPRNKLATIFLPFEQVRHEGRGVARTVSCSAAHSAGGPNAMRVYSSQTAVPVLVCSKGAFGGGEAASVLCEGFELQHCAPFSCPGGHVHQPQVRWLRPGAQHRAGGRIRRGFGEVLVPETV